MKKDISSTKNKRGYSIKASFRFVNELKKYICMILLESMITSIHIDGARNALFIKHIKLGLIMH